MSTSQTTLSTMYRDASVKAVAKASPRQTTYEDIPKFPYGYHDEEDAPKPGFLWSGSQIRPAWAPKNYKDLKLEHSFLPTTPNKYQLKNLFNQVRYHFNRSSPLAFEGDSAVNGAYTTRYPLPPSSPPAAKDTYYIIRMRTRGIKKTGRPRVFFEFLFKDEDNYLIAWRVLTTPEQCKTAHWLFFRDTVIHMNDEPFKDMAQKCNYPSAYAHELQEVEIHRTVLEDIEIFLRDLYANPLQKTHAQGSLYFHTLFVLFGECPRFAPVDDNSAGSITKHQRCVDPLGTGCLYDLIKCWKKISFTILLLKLLLVEESMIAAIKQAKPHFCDSRKISPQFQDLFEEAKLHRKKILERLASLYKDAKGLDLFAALNKQVIEADGDVGDATLQRMVTRFLHLVRFDKDLVPAILVRQDDFHGGLRLKF